MSKKILSIVFSTVLVLFSFYYTNKIIETLKEKDPIMIEIKEYDKDLNINIDKSYSNMKKIGKFDKSLLVFEEQNYQYDYHNYIESLNKKNNEVTILFELNDTSYIEEILSILKNKNISVTFFVNEEIINNSIDYIKQIINYGHDVEILSSNYSVYEVNKYNSIIKLISNERLSFCLNKNKNDKLLKSCENSKLYSIVPSIIQKNNLYNSLKYNLENGSIILLTNNKIITKELSSSINYIEQKGKKIVLLKNIIE